MTHRLSDGMPCIKERCDFCYCCGWEVTGDAPHYEIRNPEIDHFPDGPFEKCRVLKKREREAAKRRRQQQLKRDARTRAEQRVAETAPMLNPEGGSSRNLLSMAGALTYGNDRNRNPRGTQQQVIPLDREDSESELVQRFGGLSSVDHNV